MTTTKRPVELVTVALAINFLTFFAATIWFYWQNNVNEAPYPFNSFLPAPVTRFGDFFGLGDIWITQKFFGIGYGMSYFPATYLPVDLVTRFFPWPYGALFAALLSGVTLLVFGTIKIGRLFQMSWTRCLLVVVVLLTSFPTIFLIHTGNIEFWLVGSVIIGLWLSMTEKYFPAGFALGLAVAMKFMPIVFIIAYIFRKKPSSIIQTFYGLLMGVVTSTAIPLLVYPGGLRNGFGVFSNLRASQQMYADLMVWGGAGTHFGHSFLNGVNALFGQYVRQETWWIPVLVVGYLIITILVYLQFKSKSPLSEVFITCAIGICLLAPTSTDYKLTSFFPGLILLLTQAPSARSYFSTIMCCLVIAPKPYLRTNVCDYCTSSVWLTPILMIIFLVGLFAFNISMWLKLNQSKKLAP